MAFLFVESLNEIPPPPPPLQPNDRRTDRRHTAKRGRGKYEEFSVRARRGDGVRQNPSSGDRGAHLQHRRDERSVRAASGQGPNEASGQPSGAAHELSMRLLSAALCFYAGKYWFTLFLLFYFWVTRLFPATPVISGGCDCVNARHLNLILLHGVLVDSRASDRRYHRRT